MAPTNEENGAAAAAAASDKPASASGEGAEELRGIQLSVASSRTLVSDGSLGNTQKVETDHGPITISTVGDIKKPTILTYHDLGLNHITNFQSFFQYPEMRQMMQNFHLVCVNALGQEEDAGLPDGRAYPTMDQLAETIERVRNHLNLRSFIGFGVGLGANMLARYALKHPQQVDSLVLVNCCVTKSSWVEWGYQKLNIRQLKSGSMTTAAVDYLMWHHFGKVDHCQQDLVTVYRDHFEHGLNATRLGLLAEAYINRSNLGIVREMDPVKKKDARMLRCPVLTVTSNFSSHIEDVESFYGRLDPTNSNYMKVQDCGMVLEEQPGKLAEAFRLFLQGQGYAVGSSRRASSISTSHVEAVQQRRRLNCRQNSLPLIRDVPGVPVTTASNVARQQLNSLLATTAEEESATSPTDEKAPNTASDGPDKDIRITENPLEHPAV